MPKSVIKKKKVKKVKSKKAPANKGFFFTLSAVLLALVVILFFFNNYQTKKHIQSNPTDFEKSILVGLSNYLQAKGIPREYIYDDWILSNGNRAPLSGEQLLLGSDGSNGVGKYGNFTIDQLEQVNADFANKLQTKISMYFISQGFSKNNKNTNLDSETYYNTTYGYEKNNVYCLSHVAKESDPFGYITCGTINTKQMALQKELSSVFIAEQAQSKNHPITFRVDKMQGDFASGSASEGIGGYQWIAKNIQGKWEKIWAGQDFPLCADMAQYEVPKEFYPGCYNSSTQKEQRTY